MDEERSKAPSRCYQGLESNNDDGVHCFERKLPTADPCENENEEDSKSETGPQGKEEATE